MLVGSAADPPRAPGRIISTTAHPKGRAVPRILVVDDQNPVRAAIVLALQARGFDVVAADSGQAGLTKFEQSEFDVVIADLFMPGIDGVTLIKALRKRNPSFPVIAMSGSAFGHIRANRPRPAAEHLGAVGRDMLAKAVPAE